MRQVRLGVRALDNDFVGSDAVHHVVHPLAPVFQVSLNPECRVLVGDDADLPTRPVGTGSRVSNHVDLGRGDILTPLQERIAGQRVEFRLFQRLGPISSLRGDNDPASDNRIFAKFGHRTFRRPSWPRPDLAAWVREVR